MTTDVTPYRRARDAERYLRSKATGENLNPYLGVLGSFTLVSSPTPLLDLKGERYRRHRNGEVSPLTRLGGIASPDDLAPCLRTPMGVHHAARILIPARWGTATIEHHYHHLFSTSTSPKTRTYFRAKVESHYVCEKERHINTTIACETSRFFWCNTSTLAFIFQYLTVRLFCDFLSFRRVQIHVIY